MQLYHRSHVTLTPLCYYLICTAVHGPNRWCKCISLGKLSFLRKLTQCTELSNKQDRIQLVLDVLSLHSLAEFWPLRDVSGKKGHSITQLWVSVSAHTCEETNLTWCAHTSSTLCFMPIRSFYHMCLFFIYLFCCCCFVCLFALFYK